MFTLRQRTLILLATVLALLIGVEYLIQRSVMQPRFASIERDDARRDLDRCVAAIEGDAEHLAVMCADWSNWDDAWEFAQGIGDPQRFLDANMTPESLRTNRCNLIMVCDPRGNVVASRVIDLITLQPIDLPAFASTQMRAGHRLLRHGEGMEAIHGIIPTSYGPMVVASQRILPSSAIGEVAGTMIFGRFLDAHVVGALAEQTQVRFRLWMPSDPTIPVEAQALMRPDADLTRKETVTRELEDTWIAVMRALPGIDGRPSVLIQSKTPKTITDAGRAAMLYASLTSIASAILVTGLIFIILQRLIVGPVTALTQHVKQISARDDLDERISTARFDEIGELSSAFNTMLDRIRDSQDRYVEVSRAAGRSELARALLHNVGNVLNSVNVSVNMLGDAVRNSPTDGLARTTGLLESHRDDLATFFSEGNPGLQLPAYLERLASVSEERDRDLNRELRDLSSNLTHVAEIIRSQENQATSTEIMTTVPARTLLSRMRTAVGASLNRHDVKLDIRVEANPLCRVETATVMQILVNLAMNAKDAMRDISGRERRLVVGARINRDDMVEFSFRDTGEGIEPDLIDQIFQQGFTTKTSGHGIGLHYSAIAAQEFGGQLLAHSAGPGLGATFTLTVQRGTNRPASAATTREEQTS